MPNTSSSRPSTRTSRPGRRDTVLALRASALSRAADAILARTRRDGALSKNAVLNELAAAIAGPGRDWGFLKNRPDGHFVQAGIDLFATEPRPQPGSDSEPGETVRPKPENSPVPAGPAPYIACFTPQAWVNDWAIEADAEGPTEWPVYREEIQALIAWGATLAQLLTPDTNESDELRSSRHAPRWVRDWSGPYYVTLTVNPDAEDDLPCPECGDNFVRDETGEFFCPACGHGGPVASADDKEPAPEDALEADDDADPRCRTCGETYAEGGDGYDGECPSCADRSFIRDELGGGPDDFVFDVAEVESGEVAAPGDRFVAHDSHGLALFEVIRRDDENCEGYVLARFIASIGASIGRD